MNLKEIREIIKLMNDNGIMEVEVEREGSKVKIKKSCGVESDLRVSIPNKEIRPVSIKDDLNKEDPTDDEEKQIVSSPMVGTFYRSASPELAPFVKVGQTVEIGQVVCIVEAMKLMNEIKSEVRGKIVEIPVNNAQPVEFGQTLFVVE